LVSAHCLVTGHDAFGQGVRVEVRAQERHSVREVAHVYADERPLFCPGQLFFTVLRGSRRSLARKKLGPFWRPRARRGEGSAGSILAQSDVVAVLGYQIAGEFRNSYPIEIKELPFKSPEVRSIMLRRRRLDDSPGHRWLREVVAKISKKKVCPA
jgi:hypothetical protein